MFHVEFEGYPVNIYTAFRHECVSYIRDLCGFLGMRQILPSSSSYMRSVRVMSLSLDIPSKNDVALFLSKLSRFASPLFISCFSLLIYFGLTFEKSSLALFHSSFGPDVLLVHSLPASEARALGYEVKCSFVVFIPYLILCYTYQEGELLLFSRLRWFFFFFFFSLGW